MDPVDAVIKRDDLDELLTHMDGVTEQFLLLRFRIPLNEKIIAKYIRFGDFSRSIIGEDVVHTIMTLNCVKDNLWSRLPLEMIYAIFESLLWLQIPKFWI